MAFPARPEGPLQVGISQCLLGEEVRYDGTGARSSLPHAALGDLFDYTAFCPEVAIGMSIPREPIRLVGDIDSYRVLGVKDASIDKTDDLVGYAQQQVPVIKQLSGYIFMHNSPSCGLYRVKLYPPQQEGKQQVPGNRVARGVYAAAVTRALPHLPVEDAGRLFDDVLRENFVTRVFAYAHWQLVADDMTAGTLVAFHSRYKYLLMAHSISAYQTAGRLLSDLRDNVGEKAQTYIGLLMQGLQQPATANGHSNVLSHLQGYLKNHLDSASRQELAALIQAYRRGEQPLLAPLALLRHHFEKFPDEYVLQQSYLDPHPAAAGLRRAL
ncbi:MAG: DUF523 and DUF1722 domain-containing protein [Pseudomonadota bacterium]